MPFKVGDKVLPKNPSTIKLIYNDNSWSDKKRKLALDWADGMPLTIVQIKNNSRTAVLNRSENDTCDPAEALRLSASYLIEADGPSKEGLLQLL